VISLCSSTPELVRRFKANPWAYQRTLVTPRKDILGFLSALRELFPMVQGEASTDAIVFEPDNVLKFLRDRDLSLDDSWRFCASAQGEEDVQAMLAAMLSDWIDFAFVPVPETFAIYVDHDEYLTIYVPTEPVLDQVVAHLEPKGFVFVEDYIRPSGYLQRERQRATPPG
jgi:hypothetical protein